MTLYALNDVTPQVPDDGDFWVAPNAQVIGAVTLESGVGVWFGVVLRGDNEPITIGEGSNVQENTVAHTDMGYPVIVGKNCTIGHSAIIHGCTIGDNSLIGMGATVLTGAVIGKNCLIGAGALITENKVIPDGSLVMGAPGKVVRQMDERTLAMLPRAAGHYHENMKLFRETLKVVG